MKKLLLALTLLVARDTFAAYSSGGNILQPQTKYNTSTGYLTLDIDPTSLAGLTVTSSDTNSFAYMTTTAGGTAPAGGSQTAVAITGTVYTNITTAAGYNGPCQVCVYPGNGPGAAFYYLISPSSTWLAPSTPLAVSTTPVCKNVGPGAHLFLSATAAAVTVNATVQYMPLR